MFPRIASKISWFGIPHHVFFWNNHDFLSVSHQPIELSTLQWFFSEFHGPSPEVRSQEAIVKLVYSDATRDACERADYNVPMALTQNSCSEQSDLELAEPVPFKTRLCWDSAFSCDQKLQFTHVKKPGSGKHGYISGWWFGTFFFPYIGNNSYVSLPDGTSHGYFTYNMPGWWFGTWFLFFHSVGNVIIPTDELTPSFFRGLGIPPTSYFISTIPSYIHI